MSQSIETIVDEATPSTPRAEVSERLVEILEFSEAGDVQRAWSNEAVRRRDEVRSGAVQAIPGEQVMAEVRRIVAK